MPKTAYIGIMTILNSIPTAARRVSPPIVMDALLRSPNDRLENTIMEHQKILDAISSGDIDVIYTSMLVHLSNPKTMMLEDLKRNEV